MFERIMTSRVVQPSLLGAAFRKLVQATDGAVGYSPDFLVRAQATKRPHYAYCMLAAADLARRLGIDRISAIEFGVAGGNGLAFMYEFAERVRRGTGVTIDCYGFDTGGGMPDPEGVKDLPYWFKSEQYRMDVEALRRRLPDAHLVLGNVRETAPTFFAEHDPAPIGVMFNDTDYCSSTRDSLALLDEAEAHPERFLPRVPMYFDDIIGSAIEMYGPFNGQLAAIQEFNDGHPAVKVHLNQNLLPAPHIHYRYQIYYAHLLDHPRYAEYIGGGDQLEMEQRLRLRSS